MNIFESNQPIDLQNIPEGMLKSIGNNKILFKTAIDLNYPVNLIESFSNDTKQILYTTKIFNFAGFMGILPLGVRRDVLRKHRIKNDSLGDFLDIFNSRNLLFLSQLTARSTAELLATNKKLKKGKHEFNVTNSIRALVGLLAFDDKPYSKIGWKFYAFFSGFFSSRLRNHLNLVQILQGLIKMPLQIKMFTKKLVMTNETIQGKIDFSKNNNPALGVNMVLGKRMIVYQRNATIVIGPLGENDFETMLPDGKVLKLIRECVKVYWNNAVFVDVKLIRCGDSIGACFLGKLGNEKKLGWNTWLKKNYSTKDRSDCNFSLLVSGSGQCANLLGS
ncbi:MAG: type VI secretion system baseplate subunit TssG [Planctomycetia bacterium]